MREKPHTTGGWPWAHSCSSFLSYTIPPVHPTASASPSGVMLTYRKLRLVGRKEEASADCSNGQFSSPPPGLPPGLRVNPLPSTPAGPGPVLQPPRPLHTPHLPPGRTRHTCLPQFSQLLPHINLARLTRRPQIPHFSLPGPQSVRGEGLLPPQAGRVPQPGTGPPPPPQPAGKSSSRPPAQGNRLTTLASSHLSGLPSLLSLDVSDCQIARCPWWLHLPSIPEGALAGCPLLQSLHLKGNRLKAITPSFPPTLTTISLQDNPWHCDCRLGGLRRWLARPQVQLEEEPLCLTPPRLFGYRLQVIYS